jgi:acyl-coenzyme A synthetase/AMP-(fatty) acid ligase
MPTTISGKIRRVQIRQDTASAASGVQLDDDA